MWNGEIHIVHGRIWGLLGSSNKKLCGCSIQRCTHITSHITSHIVGDGPLQKHPCTLIWFMYKYLLRGLGSRCFFFSFFNISIITGNLPQAISRTGVGVSHFTIPRALIETTQLALLNPPSRDFIQPQYPHELHVALPPQRHNPWRL